MKKVFLVATRSMIVALFIVVGSSASDMRVEAQIPDPKAAQLEIEKQIELLIEKAKKSGEGTINGVKFYTRMPPDPKDIEIIQKIGVKSIPVLEKYLKEGTSREQMIAVEFLGRSGFKEIVDPLENVLRSSALSTVKIMALRFLPPEDDRTMIILARTSENDPDERVRGAAKERIVGIRGK